MPAVGGQANLSEACPSGCCFYLLPDYVQHKGQEFLALMGTPSRWHLL